MSCRCGSGGRSIEFGLAHLAPSIGCGRQIVTFRFVGFEGDDEVLGDGTAEVTHDGTLEIEIRALLVPSNSGNWLEIRDRLNRMLRGWAGYFSYGSRGVAYRAVDAHVAQRTRHFLRRRHKVASRATRQYSDHRLFGELGVLSVQSLSRAARSNASS